MLFASNDPVDLFFSGYENQKSIVFPRPNTSTGHCKGNVDCHSFNLFLKICPAYAHFSTSLGRAFDCSTRFERSFSCSGDLGPLLVFVLPEVGWFSFAVS